MARVSWAAVPWSSSAVLVLSFLQAGKKYLDAPLVRDEQLEVGEGVDRWGRAAIESREGKACVAAVLLCCLVQSCVLLG